jgi:hypothetical protein
MKRGGRAVLVTSSLVAGGLTIDLGSRLYDKVYPSPNGIRSLFRAIPARALSRTWGSIAGARIPEFLRAPLFGIYGSMFDQFFFFFFFFFFFSSGMESFTLRWSDRH